MEYTLSKLRDWRDQGGGPKIGIVDNFDDRLDTILRELGIRDFFDFVVVSRLAGSEKPHSDIFHLARRAVGESMAVVDPEHTVTCVSYRSACPSFLRAESAG